MAKKSQAKPKANKPSAKSVRATKALQRNDSRGSALAGEVPRRVQLARESHREQRERQSNEPNYHDRISYGFGMIGGDS